MSCIRTSFWCRLSLSTFSILSVINYRRFTVRLFPWILSTYGWNCFFLSIASRWRTYWLTASILSFLCFLAAGGFVFLGKHWMKAAAFPFAFLLFMTPLPGSVVQWLENASKLASADCASFFLHLTGIPVLRDGTIFQLPGIVIEVAQECSGIRSSLVLLIASILASYLFLRRPSHRLILVLVAIPLGVLRNGFRITVIGLLCVRFGPQMIHSIIHKRGGPAFFVLSLIPLIAVLWALRANERSIARKMKTQRRAGGRSVTTSRTTRCVALRSVEARYENCIDATRLPASAPVAT